MPTKGHFPLHLKLAHVFIGRQDRIYTVVWEVRSAVVVPCCAMQWFGALCCAVLYYRVLCCLWHLRCAMPCTGLHCAVLALPCRAVLGNAGVRFVMPVCAVLCWYMLRCDALCCARGAVFSGTVIRCAVLCCAALCCAVRCAVLCCAVLCAQIPLGNIDIRGLIASIHDAARTDKLRPGDALSPGRSPERSLPSSPLMLTSSPVNTYDEALDMAEMDSCIQLTRPLATALTSLFHPDDHPSIGMRPHPHNSVAFCRISVALEIRCSTLDGTHSRHRSIRPMNNRNCIPTDELSSLLQDWY